tara:strand:- start:95 stop:775 length:681 start_codon:yes stop_codon:yes gene_type:complete
MKLKINLKKSKLISIINKLIQLNKINDGYIRPIVFRSSHSMSPETKNCKSLIAIATWKWGTLFSNDKGITLTLSKYPRLNSSVYPIQAKSSGSYQVAVISRVEADRKKFDDCLMLDLKKNVAETSACNIFWIKKNVVYTPKKHSILNGVTRRCIVKLCSDNNIKIKINDYKIKDILSADSVFITGTAAEIQPVKSIEKKKFKINSKIITFLKNKYEILKKNGPSYL